MDLSSSRIKCSTCDADVPLQLIAEHVCRDNAFAPLTNDLNQVQAQISSDQLLQHASSRPPRPLVPRIDPYAPNKFGSYGDLTPASSGPGSATASPVSSGRISPLLPPPRKVSAPVQAPLSPELLSQDCAFPPFPTTKSKKREASKSVRGRNKTPDSSRSKSSSHGRMRSASVGAQRSRLRYEIGDSSQPSTASSSRSGSRRGSFDVVPPVPILQAAYQKSPSDQDTISGPSDHNDFPMLLADVKVTQRSPEAEFLPAPEPTTPEIRVDNPTITVLPVRNASLNLPDPKTHSREPSYRAKRPPPITNLPSNDLNEPPIPKSETSPRVPPTPSTPGSSLARTLTSLFRKKSQSSSNKKNGPKSPAMDGPRFVALSPDPDPQSIVQSEQSLPSLLNHDTIITPPTRGIQEAPRSTIDVVSTAGHIRNSSHAQIVTPDEFEEEAESALNMHGIPEFKRDTLQMEEDFESRLAAMTQAPHQVNVEEQIEDVKRASIDSASSYGSVGFSNSSTSSRSFHRFEGHSQGSSISTARTMSSSEDGFLINLQKTRSFNPETVPDSPTDPFLQHGRLQPVPEGLSSHREQNTDPDLHLQNGRLSTVQEVLVSPDEETPEPVFPTPESDLLSPDSDLEKFDFQHSTASTLSDPITPESEPNKSEFPHLPQARRPSTPGTTRGTCRGCSQRILSGQKSVSSKDGRLTGRYHKECFVCMTCKHPFATADFYVHNDHPYCAHHYHVLNQTLCESCGKGIEGHYLETSTVSGSSTKKFHPQCLRCATCKIQLNDEYFEFGGKVYCERDAFRLVHGGRSPYGTAPSRPSPLNREYISSGEPRQGLAAGRFPERRLTRLMTMR